MFEHSINQCLLLLPSGGDSAAVHTAAERQAFEVVCCQCLQLRSSRCCCLFLRPDGHEDLDHLVLLPCRLLALSSNELPKFLIGHGLQLLSPILCGLLTQLLLLSLTLSVGLVCDQSFNNVAALVRCCFVLLQRSCNCRACKTACGSLSAQQAINHNFFDKGIDACMIAVPRQGPRVHRLELSLPSICSNLGERLVDAILILPLLQQLLHSHSLGNVPCDAVGNAKLFQLLQWQRFKLSFLLHHGRSHSCCLCA
mmetsp:Transcript_54175/g.129012  ORF Transcript_54175/g.129012 Transcript_54175/m.129012 type:complete len:254 (+) Transcript_54175:745-1506(+)